MAIRLDTEIVFRVRHYWEIGTMVSTNCAAQRCSAGHALAGIGIANVTLLQSAHDRQPCQPVMVNDIATLARRALVEVCTVSVLLVSMCVALYCTVC